MTITPETINKMREAANCKPWRLSDAEMEAMARAVLEACAQDWVRVPDGWQDFTRDELVELVEQLSAQVLAAAPPPPDDEKAKADRDLLLYGESFMVDGQRIDPSRVTIQYGAPPAESALVADLRRLSARIRPDCEAAPWVCSELRALVARHGGSA
jgi:hypothetical protein